MKPRGRGRAVATRLVGRLDARLGVVAGSALERGRLVNLRYFWLDGLSSSFSDNFVLGFLELFLLGYHANNATIGTMSSVASLMAMVAMVPGARFVARHGRRKDFVVWTAGWMGRLTLLAVAFLPLVVRDSGVAIACLIVLNAVRSLGNSLANPGATALVADLVPQKIRARYFASRNVATIVAAAIAAPLAGWIVKAFNGGADLPWLGFQLIYFVAFAAGMVATQCFGRIREPAPAAAKAALPSIGGLLRDLFRNRVFVGLVGSAFLWNLAVAVGGPFFGVYFVKELGANAAWVGIVAGIASVGGLFGQALFSRLSDKFGDIRLQAVIGIIICILPLTWLVMTMPWHVSILNLFGGFLWAGYNLVAFNVLLELTPDGRRAEAVAVYQTIVALSTAIGSFIGGTLADFAGFRAIFITSGAGRFAATLLFIALVARLPLGRGGGHRTLPEAPLPRLSSESTAP